MDRLINAEQLRVKCPLRKNGMKVMKTTLFAITNDATLQSTHNTVGNVVKEEEKL